MALFGPLTFFWARFIERLPLPPARRFVTARERLDAYIYRMLRLRRRYGADDGDLPSMLLLAQDAESDGQGVTDQQVRDEVVTVFLAGHETTANALTWSWWLLAQHPEAEQRLHAEADEVLGDRLPTSADLPSLPYVSGIIAEALRLYPPAAMIFRRALENHPVGEYVISRGGIVTLSQYVMHRDPAATRSPTRSILAAGPLRCGPSADDTTTSPSAADRGYVSARDSRRWEACQRWPPSHNAGIWGYIRKHRCSATPSSGRGRVIACVCDSIAASRAPWTSGERGGTRLGIALYSA